MNEKCHYVYVTLFTFSLILASPPYVTAVNKRRVTISSLTLLLAEVFSFFHVSFVNNRSPSGFCFLFIFIFIKYSFGHFYSFSKGRLSLWLAKTDYSINRKSTYLSQGYHISHIFYNKLNVKVVKKLLEILFHLEDINKNVEGKGNKYFCLKKG